MTGFLLGLTTGFCLIAAAGLTLLRVAFMRISFANIIEWQGRRLHEVRIFRKLAARQDSVLSVLHFGYLLCITAFIVLMTHTILAASSGLQIAVSVTLLLIMVIIFAEALPKSFALKQSDDFVLRLIPAIQLVYYLFVGPCYIVTQLFSLLTGAFKSRFFHLEHLVNTFEFMPLVNRDQQEKSALDPIAQKEHQMQKNLTGFADRVVEEFMIPVSEIELIDGSQPMEELVTTVLETQAQRMLVFQDEPENLIGVMHTPLMLKAIALCEGDKNAIDLSSAISEPWFITPTTPVLEQIGKFQQRGEHFALIRDRQNNLKGAVSLDTLLENMAGVFNA